MSISGEEEKLYCFCQNPKEQSFMIECDQCSEWFHGKCVKISKQQADSLDKWYCPTCQPAAPEQEQQKPFMTDKLKKLLKRKSMDEHAAVKKPINPIRQKVIDNLQKLLEKFGDQSAYKIKELSKEIELEMHKTFATKDDAYREKFRTLHFNLKDQRTIQKVLSGEWTPQLLIQMTPEDFADDSVKQERQKIQEDSLRQSILTADQANSVLKKTHKGEVLVERKAENVQPTLAEGDINTFVASATESLSTHKSSSSTEVIDVVEDAEAISIEQQQQRGKSLQLDDLMLNVKVTTDMVSTDVVTSPSKSSSYENLQTASQKVVYQPKGFNQLWSGQVKMEGVGQFNGALMTEQASLKWLSLLPQKLIINGRIQPSVVDGYVAQQYSVETRQVHISQLFPHSDQEFRGFDGLFNYFKSRNRYAVVPNVSDRVKDMYLVPLDVEDPLPSFLQASSEFKSVRECKMFIIVVVAVSGNETPVIQSNDKIQQSYHPQVPMASNINQALSILGSAFPMMQNPQASSAIPTHSYQPQQQFGSQAQFGGVSHIEQNSHYNLPQQQYSYLPTNQQQAYGQNYQQGTHQAPFTDPRRQGSINDTKKEQLPGSNFVRPSQSVEQEDIPFVHPSRLAHIKRQ